MFPKNFRAKTDQIYMHSIYNKNIQGNMKLYTDWTPIYQPSKNTSGLISSIMRKIIQIGS